MTHLSPEALLDIAEDTGQADIGSHLASCRECQHHLAQLKSVMVAVSEAAGSDVPEPSPLFWEHLSARVHEATANEKPRRWARWSLSSVVPGAWGRLGAFSAVAVAVMVVAVMIPSRPPQPAASISASSESAAVLDADSGTDASAPGADVAEVAEVVDDPSFGVVSDLTGDMDVETAMAAGLASEGSAEHAVLHMTSGELIELQRLLKDQMSGSQKS
jgi:hypothetical protein